MKKSLLLAVLIIGAAIVAVFLLRPRDAAPPSTPEISPLLPLRRNRRTWRKK
jgi:hypothetical protein